MRTVIDASLLPVRNKPNFLRKRANAVFIDDGESVHWALSQGSLTVRDPSTPCHNAEREEELLNFPRET
jgi:hypothetical protein